MLRTAIMIMKLINLITTLLGKHVKSADER